MGVAPEDQLLILCSRSRLNGRDIDAAAQLLQTELDWEYILNVSIPHCISPLLYWGLKQVDTATGAGEYVPAAAWAGLKNLYEHSKARNHRMYGVLGDIAAAFQSAGVAVMAIKDVQLTWEVYPDVGLRPMGDIDILIRRQDYETASRCMRGLGFAAPFSGDVAFRLKYAPGFHLRRPGDNVCIDLQWDVLQREWDTCREGNFDFQIERFWRGAREMRLAAQQLLVPKPEDMLFHICLHLEGHRYYELILLCDIVEFLRHYDGRLDWDYVVGLAESCNAKSSLCYALFWVQRLFGAPVPPYVLESLKPAYFAGNLFTPLYDNLIKLHVALDDIRLAAQPPRRTMREFECEARRQAARAMHIFRQADEIAGAFHSAGGELLIWEGSPSERIYPSPSLRPFEDLYGFLLPSDHSRLCDALKSCGFQPGDEDAGCDGPTMHKQCDVVTADPVLRGERIGVDFQVAIEKDALRLFRENRNRRGLAKKSALKSLKTTSFSDVRPSDNNISVRLRFIELTAEELALYQCAELGKHAQKRLFRLCSLAELLGRHRGPLDWRRMAQAAQRHNVEESAWQGLSLMCGLFDEGRARPPNAAEMDDVPPLRLLEHARYDAELHGKYAAFKPLFYYALSWLSTRGVMARAGYLIKSFSPLRPRRLLLPRLMLRGAVNAVTRRRQPKRNGNTFAYWTEPEKIEPRNATPERPPGKEQPA